MEEFFLFLAVGLLAQTIDGALGMAYGLTSSTVLLSFGVPPAQASAATHIAESFTTAASGTSHIIHRNVNWRLFFLLTPFGMAGGALGAYVLTSFDGQMLRPFIFSYLLVMGLYIIWRMVRGALHARLRARTLVPLGGVGGFVDAVGGGGWGPIVTTTLVGSGENPRYAIGTVNTAEFFVTVTISAAFIFALLTGHWDDAGNLTGHAAAVAGLIVGGLIAAPFASVVVRHVPVRALGLGVGFLIVLISAYQLARFFELI